MSHTIKKRFGQHFLTDAAIISDILTAIAPEPGDNIIEIGPGMGAITEPLLSKVNRLSVIEIDRELIGYWQRRYPDDRLHVIAGDVLALDFSELASPFRLVGNLPYNISTPILMKMRDVSDCLIDAHFMLQKEVIDRIAASPGSKTYGRLSIMLQAHFEVLPLFDVPPGAFDPPPKVDSAVIRMWPTDRFIKEISDYAVFENVVRLAFCQRRKTITNSLKSVLSVADFEQLGINPSARAETLSVTQFIEMANYVTQIASQHIKT